MRLQARAAPDAEDQHVTDPERFRQLARAPMRAAIRRALPRPGQHGRFHRRRPDVGRLAAILRAEPGQPFGPETAASHRLTQRGNSSPQGEKGSEKRQLRVGKGSETVEPEGSLRLRTDINNRALNP
jgi:hypothetical protein